MLMHGAQRRRQNVNARAQRYKIRSVSSRYVRYLESIWEYEEQPSKHTKINMENPHEKKTTEKERGDSLWRSWWFTRSPSLLFQQLLTMKLKMMDFFSLLARAWEYSLGYNINDTNELSRMNQLSPLYHSYIEYGGATEEVALEI